MQELSAEAERFAQRLPTVEAQIESIGGLIERVRELPLVENPDRVFEKQTELLRTDVDACLGDIAGVCRDLGARDLREDDDASRFIARLDRAIGELERRGAPEISVLPAPDGSVDGRPGRRPVEELTVRRSRGVTYGVGNTVHVVHDCAVERPVVEIAELLRYNPSTNEETWNQPLDPVRAAGAEDMRTTITHSSGVVVGVGNHQRNVFQHRIGSCSVTLGPLASAPRVQHAIHLCHESGGTPETMRALRRAVRQAVDATDVSALVPDRLVAGLAAAQQDTPELRGRGPALTIRHGAGVCVGWDSVITSETRTRVGKPRVK
ncbi:hypothetical protein KOI35_13645 [Actinoplanes bogorensis]|uniref:Uncharacterized protein n=1 Tax=Paractinoplanes bogorensis TaxID=1610840 RepID=A0ABS5YM66_9ACTN|nr:hypothetical protein [Actinoplanes bogorensis]MBU2664541.1 hypothetical protein [Actinoplanes bogorensis]